jgi:hypothetical protein
MIFDRYVTVDWSASNRPRRGRDSIWICSLGPTGEPQTTNPATRRGAESQIRDLLIEAVGLGERVLVGFDFPLGYPSNLSAALALEGPAWRAIWEYLRRGLVDADTNASNRFEVAARINARLASQAFWGRPATQFLEHLSSRRDQVLYRIGGETAGLAEWREVKAVLHQRGRHPQSTWKLLGAGSVGSQALTGIPVVARLRHCDELAGVSQVWPFEVIVPELEPGCAAIVHAEIWPSLIQVSGLDGQVRDEAQVIRLAQEFRGQDRSGTMHQIFAAAASSAAREEGWILGVPGGDRPVLT